MIRPCYDCQLEFKFADDAPEDGIFLCAVDIETRRLARTFDNSPEQLANFAPSEPLVLLGRPVAVSRTRVHTSKQEGLVTGRRELHRADV